MSAGSCDVTCDEDDDDEFDINSCAGISLILSVAGGHNLFSLDDDDDDDDDKESEEFDDEGVTFEGLARLLPEI